MPVDIAGLSVVGDPRIPRRIGRRPAASASTKVQIRTVIPSTDELSSRAQTQSGARKHTEA